MKVLCMKNIKVVLETKSQSQTNLIILLIGLLFVILGSLSVLFWNTAVGNCVVSVGASLIATSIATWLTSHYIVESNTVKDIINHWKLKNIYESKTQMNITSNECLDKAKRQLDIIAVGMASFLNVKRDVLESKAISGVKIRIISCNNAEMIDQREKDETFDGAGKTNDRMKEEVKDLSKWVEDLKASGGSVEIKYHSTYPGFSYLRIDDNVFFGPNFPLYKSQLNFAMQFNVRGEGGIYLDKYFNKLKVCSDELNL